MEPNTNNLNSTPSAARLQIGIFGKRNAGKSSLLNALTEQELSIVDDTPGTTTDPVKKAMELPGVGAVVLIDTPGLDDVGELGKKRVERARNTLKNVDIILYVHEKGVQYSDEERRFLEEIRVRGIPFLLVESKADLDTGNEDGKVPVRAYPFSAKDADADAVSRLREEIIALKEKCSRGRKKRMLGDYLSEGDIVVFVIPIDAEAPEGRLILPQQMAIRECLDAGACGVTVQPENLQKILTTLKGQPRLVVTDSQAFAKVEKIVPQEIPLTSFSILLARMKGNLEAQAEGARKIRDLQDGDRILIAEGCTHHRTCGDIGTEKLPKLIQEYTKKKELVFEHTMGIEFPEDLHRYALLIHCGGCVLPEKEMQYRLEQARLQGIPATNFGTAIAQMRGILERALCPLRKFSEFF